MENRFQLSELNEKIKSVIQANFEEPVWIVAEVSELNVNRTGHCYLELVEKDPQSNAILARARATIWSWQFRFINPFFETTTGQPLSAGMKILVSATVEYHEVYGFSLNIKDVDPAYTLGDMARKRREVIERLHAEGIFDMNKELELPEIPSRIAIISSPTAAGYEDFMKQLLHNQWGFVFQTKLFPALMQGNEAPQSIINAINEIYAIEEQFDAVVLIRGGGSQLDLACFDDYELAANLAQFPLPVLTGIGHEKDESVADMVAHTRLKTPTAVAEFLLGLFHEVYTEIEELRTRLETGIETYFETETRRMEQALRMLKPLVGSALEKRNSQVARLSQALKPLVIQDLTDKKNRLNSLGLRVESTVRTALNEQRFELKQLQTKLVRGVGQQLRNRRLEQDTLNRNLTILTNRYLEQKSEQLVWLKKNIDLVDPANVLKRGYSITLCNGKLLKDVPDLQPGDRIETQYEGGTIQSDVQSILHRSAEHPF